MGTWKPQAEERRGTRDAESTGSEKAEAEESEEGRRALFDTGPGSLWHMEGGSLGRIRTRADTCDHYGGGRGVPTFVFLEK